MGNKTGLITPFLMLLAGAIASIIMYVRGYELTNMLWGLLIVLLIFYILGDVARYLYASIRPRIIPTGDLEQMVQEAKKMEILLEMSWLLQTRSKMIWKVWMRVALCQKMQRDIRTRKFMIILTRRLLLQCSMIMRTHLEMHKTDYLCRQHCV